MKFNINKLAFLSVLLILVMSNKGNAQVLSNGKITNQYFNNNAFLEGASNFDSVLSGDNNNGKGLVFPRTDLTKWQFLTDDLDGGYIPTAYDGMIVYNTGTGPSATTGKNPSTATAVTPGFYYFSNPSVSVFDAPSITGGVWMPLGGGASTSVKSKTITAVAADGVSATLNLGTSVITENEVVEFLGAKVYNAAGDLVIEAFSDYEKATNILATGNGMMYQVLPAGTYKVLVEYK